MKKAVIWLMCCLLVAVALGATKDDRNDGMRPIGKLQFTQQSWASGVTDAATTSINNCNMLIERIDVVASNSTNAITWSVAIADENAADVIPTISSIPENDTTTKLATKATADFDAIPVNNTLTVTITPSGDPGASGATVDVILYGP